MDTYQFIAALVASLAWPLAAVTLGLLLRGRVLKLLERTTSAEAFGTKLTFGERVEAVREIVESEAPPEVVSVLKHPLSKPTESTKVISDALAQSSPAGSIVAAWAELDQALRATAKAQGQPWRTLKRTISPTQLGEMGLFDDLIRSIESLRKLRNEVVDGRTSPSSDAAANYRASVDRLLATLPLFKMLDASERAKRLRFSERFKGITPQPSPPPVGPTSSE